MSITWKTYKANSWHTDVTDTKVTHEGLVVSPSWSKEERVMSDVYAMVRYCRVWNPETRKAETVNLGAGFECCLTHGTAVVDAPADILAEVARQDAKAKAEREAYWAARREREARERAERERNRPEKGKWMRVVRGRKVPQGTEGRVFWLDNFRNPTRVGLALDDEVDDRGRHVHVAWVNAAYLVAA